MFGGVPVVHGSWRGITIIQQPPSMAIWDGQTVLATSWLADKLRERM